jgi:GT2 family glycosyltransferase
MSDIPRIVRNDWSAVTVPPLGRWRPDRTVSVVIPAHGCQEMLDLTLASLAHQTYPPHLLDVVVVDDGSAPPLELPKIRPERCRLLRVGEGWGRANALRLGARHSQGEIIHWLDADMVVYQSHVEAQARWHHRLPYAVTLGWKRFVDGPWPTPDRVADACGAGAAGRLFADRPSRPHDYVERIIARTGQLRDADHLAFMVHVGATAALSRELYEAAGGLDPALRLGEDTEFGYRLAQAGAVFIPEPAARSWHLGRTHMMRHEVALQRYNRPFLAERMPLPRWLRTAGGAGSVPLVTVVMRVGTAPLEQVRAAVDSVLASDEPDLRVLLVGAWASLSEHRVRVLDDPLLDLRLMAASYRRDPRVRLVEQAPDSAFPSPHLLTMPVSYALAPIAIRRLVEHADRERLGLVRVGDSVRLWRTSAVSRARWVRRGDEPLADLVAQIHGAGDLAVERLGVVDLAGFTAVQLADGVPAPALRAGRWLPSSVEVAGVRSLARAAWVVARLIAHRAWSRLRRGSTGTPNG